MYIVDRIEEDIVVLEETKTKKIINVSINNFKDNPKEGDIVIRDNVEYKLDKKNTEIKKIDIRKRFNSIKKKKGSK